MPGWSGLLHLAGIDRRATRNGINSQEFSLRRCAFQTKDPQPPSSDAAGETDAAYTGVESNLWSCSTTGHPILWSYQGQARWTERLQSHRAKYPVIIQPIAWLRRFLSASRNFLCRRSTRQRQQGSVWKTIVATRLPSIKTRQTIGFVWAYGAYGGGTDGTRQYLATPHRDCTIAYNPSSSDCQPAVQW